MSLMQGYLKCFGAIIWVTLISSLPLRAQSPDIAYIDINKEWNVINASQWPSVPAAARNTIRGGITFNVVYLDVVNNTNVGFDDPADGATRQATVTSVLMYIDGILNETGVLDIEFQNSETDGTGFLASAGALHFTSPNGFSSGFAFDHITTGTDPCNAACGGGTDPPDMTSTVDFGYTWNSDTGSPTGGEFDFFSVILHEITHGLGIASLTDENGNSAISGGDPGVFATFDDFLFTGNGTDLFTAGGNFNGVATDLEGMDGGVEFTGANAVADFGGNLPIFAPAMFVDGSSIGHWDSGISGTPVMVPSIGMGVEARAYDSYEIDTLIDLGYSNAVPVVLQSFEIE